MFSTHKGTLPDHDDRVCVRCGIEIVGCEFVGFCKKLVRPTFFHRMDSLYVCQRVCYIGAPVRNRNREIRRCTCRPRKLHVFLYVIWVILYWTDQMSVKKIAYDYNYWIAIVYAINTVSYSTFYRRIQSNNFLFCHPFSSWYFARQIIIWKLIPKKRYE